MRDLLRSGSARAHRRIWIPRPRLIAVALLSAVTPIRAQYIGGMSLPAVTGDTLDRIRLRQLLGDSIDAGFLLRAPSRLAGRAPGWGFVSPEVHTVNNSGLPFSMNQGALWAGRGFNAELTGGLFVTEGRWRLILDPAVVSEQNLPFQVIPYSQNANPPRSIWANPYHPPPESIDLPLRFGDQPRRRLDAGQSSLTLDLSPVSAGIATENLWWGPGIQNAITLSDNAPGFPHFFLQPSHAVRTRAGTFDAQYIVGQLSQSDFFDSDPNSHYRSLTGLAVTWMPPVDSGLTVGFARVVMANRNHGSIRVSAPLDVFRSVGHPDTDTTGSEPHWGDQISSLFARWVFRPGFETYAEWARFEEPLSLRDFLEYPAHSEGYTLGLQWAKPLTNQRAFQLQTELTYLEPDPSLRLRPVATTYTSDAVPQGFTNQGETLGAAIGPGSSSQWLSGDLIAPKSRFGVYLERIRWDNGTLFEPIVPAEPRKMQDVTLLAGVRGSILWGKTRVAIDFAHAARFNYLYQAFVLGPGQTGGVDILNNTLTVTLSTIAGIR